MKWFWPINTRRQLAKLKKSITTATTATTATTTTKVAKIDLKDSSTNDLVVEKLNENLLTIDIDAKKVELQLKQATVREEDKPLKDISIRKVYEQRLESFINDTQPTTSNEDRNKETRGNHDDEELSEREIAEDEDGVCDEEDGRERYMNDQARLEKEKKSSDYEASSDDERTARDAADHDDGKDEDESDFEQELNELAESNLLYNQELIKKKIDMICLYLRDKYVYCVWCGTRFDDADELEKNCPGLTEPDHDES